MKTLVTLILILIIFVCVLSTHIEYLLYATLIIVLLFLLNKILVKYNNKNTYTSIYHCKIIKPHKIFKPNDRLLVQITNGQGTYAKVWGWSSKRNKMVHDYYIKYQGWKNFKPNNSGYCTELLPIETKVSLEFLAKLSHLASREKFNWELNQLCGSNFPQ